MRADLKRILSAVAIFAIFLHTSLWGVAALLLASPAVDPFTIICHSETPAATDQPPSHAPLAPTQACDHCNLCSAVAAPVPNTAPVAQFEPAQILQVLHPAAIARHDDLTATPKLARGPPVFA
ncbi:MAG TPA: hypothetical protein VEH78_03885 [Pseudolabrys sp.]|nr:hypothetical protein [Pseudolabrys sp.]